MFLIFSIFSQQYYTHDLFIPFVFFPTNKYTITYNNINIVNCNIIVLNKEPLTSLVKRKCPIKKKQKKYISVKTTFLKNCIPIIYSYFL